MTCTETLKAHVSPEIKLQAKAIADREFLSEAAWLKRLVLREIQYSADRTPPGSLSKRIEWRTSRLPLTGRRRAAPVPAKKGTRPPGRKRGVPNKVTQSAREIFAAFLDHNAPRAQEWIDRTAVRNPAKALDVLLRLSEFFLPKLQRTEVVAQQRLLPAPQINISFPDGGPGQPSAATKHKATEDLALLGEVDLVRMRAEEATKAEEDDKHEYYE